MRSALLLRKILPEVTQDDTLRSVTSDFRLRIPLIDHAGKVFTVNVKREGKSRRGGSPTPQGFAYSEETLRLWSFFASIRRREHVPRGRCLAGSSRRQTPPDQRKLFARTSRCQHDCV